MVYSVESRKSMMQVCDACPGKSAQHDYLMELAASNDTDAEDIILSNGFI
jgi:hypothetical protein